MFCQECGAVVPEGSTFCEACAQSMLEGKKGTGEESYSPGDVFQAPPVSKYLEQQARTRYPGAPLTDSVAPASSTSSKRAPLIAGSLGISGLVIIVSTFLQWVSATGGYFIISSNPTGWDFMVHGGSTGFGNFAYTSGGGVLYFSGFWSLTVGLAVIIGSVLLFMRIGVGGRVAGIAGIIGAALAVINVIMTYKTMGGGVGIGVVLFLLMSICSVIAGELGQRAL